MCGVRGRGASAGRFEGDRGREINATRWPFGGLREPSIRTRGPVLNRQMAPVVCFLERLRDEEQGPRGKNAGDLRGLAGSEIQI